MNDRERFVVEVRETIAVELIGHEGRLYVGPPQHRGQALELVALLLGHPPSVNGDAAQPCSRQLPASMERQAATREVKIVA
ncbi:MAG: hypothetical protein JOY89_12190 [Solirubrobacterales bacterium]|nr:hypothetical protein [Solirubrobacterales bacterium]